MRLEKKSISDEIRSWLVNVAYVIFTDYRGMQVRQTNDLRRRLAKLQARLHVVPNRQCKLVMAELKWGVADEAFVGPTALISGSGDAVEAAKLLNDFMAVQRLPRIKLGRFEGRFFTPADMEVLVQLPARPVLYAMLAGTLAAPMVRLAGVLNQKVLSLVYVIKAAQDKKSQSK